MQTKKRHAAPPPPSASGGNDECVEMEVEMEALETPHAMPGMPPPPMQSGEMEE